MSSAVDDLQTIAEGCFKAAFSGVLRIECTDDGSSVWIDGRDGAPAVSQNAPPEVSSQFCLWRGEKQVLRSVLAGQRKLETAYVAGQIKISGDMAVMARIELEQAA